MVGTTKIVIKGACSYMSPGKVMGKMVRPITYNPTCLLKR